MLKYKIFILDHRTYALNSLGDALAQLGHQIAYQSSWVNKEVEAGIAYFKPDILMTVGYNRPLFSRFADLLPDLCKKYRLFHIYWATEDYINHDNWSLPYIKRVKPDLIWTIHPTCVAKYEELGIPASYLNFAFNPRYFSGKSHTDKELFNISFVGATHLFKKTYRYNSLQHLLFPLVQAGQKTHVWGNGWRNKAEIAKIFGQSVPRPWLQGHLPYGQSGKVYRSSKIVLGVQNAEDQVTQRTFEILGSGAFMLASKTPAITSLFKDKKDLVVSSSPEETLDLVSYYRSRPELRLQIGSNARQKVLANYTYHHQLEKIWPKAALLLSRHQNN